MRPGMSATSCEPSNRTARGENPRKKDGGSVSAGTLSSTDRAASQLRGGTESQHCTYVRFGGSREHLPRSPVGSGVPRQQPSSDTTEPRPHDSKGHARITERHFRPEASPLFQWSGGPGSSVRRVAEWMLSRYLDTDSCANRGAVRPRFESLQTERGSQQRGV